MISTRQACTPVNTSPRGSSMELSTDRIFTRARGTASRPASLWWEGSSSKSPVTQAATNT